MLICIHRGYYSTLPNNRTGTTIFDKKLGTYFFVIRIYKNQLEPSCCKKRQKKGQTKKLVEGSECYQIDPK